MKNPRFFPRLAAGLFTLTAAGALPVVLSTLTLPPAVARAAEEGGEVSFDFFYSNLGDNGDWYNTPDFGYVFQPYIAYKNEGWRPYTDGYWAQTDQGWTWVSYEDFGWACYHYGRWSQLENVGWVWVPGYEWGPGWVSWRTSEDYVGWAPLPPKATRRVAATTVERAGGARVVTEEEETRSSGGGGERVYEGRVLRPEDVEEDYDTGYNAGVDAQYDIGPGQYSFVPVQSFGAPYLAEAVVPVAQNVVIIEGTNNVTNIVYRTGERDRRVIYCGGPDYASLSRRVERPIPRLLLERRTNVVAERGNPRADRFNAVRDNRLEFFAPLVSRQAVNFNQVRPARVKENLERPQVIHGWRGAQQQDPRLVERLRERFQQQARQAPPARQVAENFVTPAAFRAQPPPTIQEQQRQHQPPPPRTAEGGRFGNNNGQPTANQPPAPTVVPPPGTAPGQPAVSARPAQPGPPVNPNPAVQPAPGPGGRNLTDAERQARRDARQRELEQRQGNRPAASPPNNPPPPPNVVNPGNTPPTPPVPPPAGQQPPRPNRTAEEREANRAAKQAERAARAGQTPPPAPAPENNPAVNKPPVPPSPGQLANPDRAARRQAREQAVPRPDQPPATPPDRDANAERAREERRAARPKEPGAPQPAQPQQAQVQQQPQEAARQQQRAERQEQRRAERPPQAEQPRPREVQPPPQAQPPRPAPEARRPAEARPPQPPQPAPGPNKEKEEGKKRDEKEPR